MVNSTRKIGTTIIVALMLLSAGCLGFGGTDQTPTNETPTNGDGDTPQYTMLNESMSVAEIAEQTREDTKDVSPYTYTMESTSTVRVFAESTFTITQEKTHETTVNDIDETRYVEYNESYTISSPETTNTTSSSGVYYESPNVNTIRYDDSSQWQYPGSNYGFVDPFVLLTENMNSPTVSTESTDTIVISETLNEIDDRGLFTNARSVISVAGVTDQQTEISIVIQNEENAPNVVESIEVTSTETGVANSTAGGQSDFESEMSTTIEYNYESVSPIETPDGVETEENDETE